MAIYKIYENGTEINRIVADKDFCDTYCAENGYTYRLEVPMTIIKIEKNDNGSHNNQTINGVTPETFPIPEGYALLPEDVGTPDTLENYPFGDITVEDIDGYPTVTSWTPLPIPDPGPEPEPEPSQLDRVEAQAVYTALVTDTLLPEEV